MVRKPTHKKTSTQPLAIVDPLARYVREVLSYPFLTAEEEMALAHRFHEHHDVEAARKLVMAHLRLVVKIAMEYRNAYFNVLDLIQEGNVGLLKAVKQFHPEKGARLGTYAQWWIRSYILKYILDNFRLIKLGTTRSQKKLFFNLMREKERIEALGYRATPELISKQLGVGATEVREMERRLSEPELAIDKPIAGSEEGKERLLGDFLAGDERPADEVISEQESKDILKRKFSEFSEKLNDREQKIFQERLLAELPLTLQEIADEYGITKERVRQIEERLIGRLKYFFQEGGIEDSSIGQ